MRRTSHRLSLVATGLLAACSAQETTFQGKNARLKSADVVMEPATIATNVAGANLVFECRIHDTLRGDGLTGLECFFTDLLGAPIVASIAFEAVEKFSSSGNSAIAFSSTGVPPTLSVPNLPVSDFIKGEKLTVRSRVENTNEVMTIELSSLSAQARAADALTPPTPMPAASPTPTPTQTPAPAASPTPTPAPTPTKASLYGQWAGLCGFNDGQNSCGLMKVGEIISKGSCSDGFVYQEVASRFQGAGEGSAEDNRRMAACLRSESSPLDAEIRANPKDFAVKGNWYGVCYYTVVWDKPLFGSGHDEVSPTCDNGFMFPMKKDKTCPVGFTFTHIAAQRGGNNERWVGTCVANNTGAHAEAPPSSAIQGFCAYGYDPSKTQCVHAKSGSAIERRQCSNGDVFYPFNGRYGGEDVHWSGVCVKP